jgi:DNA-binding MarR family transcriptional regulator
MGALTRIMDGLEHSGYVRRERSDQDRRAVDITLTQAGRRQAEACLGLVVGLLNELVEPFSRSEIDTLIPLLQRLFQRLNQRLDVPREKPAMHPRGKSPSAKNRRTPRGA